MVMVMMMIIVIIIIIIIIIIITLRTTKSCSKRQKLPSTIGTRLLLNRKL